MDPPYTLVIIYLHVFGYCLQGDIITVGVLAGSRNSESRVFPVIRANYLMSPMLVVAYALAGTVAIDFETEPIGMMLHNSLFSCNDSCHMQFIILCVVNYLTIETSC